MNSRQKIRNILALNIGSASLKAASYTLAQSPEADRPAFHETGRTVVEAALGPASTAADTAAALLDQVLQHFSTRIKPPDIVVHRIVHGGDRVGPVELTQATLAELDSFDSWAPLHQGPALALVGAASQRYSSARQIGVFDSSWHQTMPQEHRILPIPYSLYARGVKRYGFHGLAFQSVMRQLSVIAPVLAQKRIVLAHLGGGSSLCAVLNGESVNTTMGMTPLSGIPMATRSGSLDPGVLLHLQRGLGMSAAEIDRLLWYESGLKGISEESGDMRKLLASGSDGARLAIEVYISGIARGIAAMATCIKGIDALVFSGGIGMHSAEVRRRVTHQLGWLGLDIDAELNESGAEDLTSMASVVSTYALPVDEEKEMAIASAGFEKPRASTAL